MLVLRRPFDGYTERAWCFFELLAGHTVIKNSLEYAHEVECDADSLMGEARNVVQQAVLGCLAILRLPTPPICT